MKMYRQGDVLLVSGSVPKTAQITRRKILVRGEATGHHHSIADLAKARLWIDGDTMYVRVGETVEIVHQEHDPLILPAGDYEVVRQREYTPEAIRNVAD